MPRHNGDDEGAAARAKLVGAPFFVLPDYLENWALMTKKEFLAIQEIYQYQDMSAAEISAVFFQLGVQRGANLFYLMLQSFKIASRVANAAWGLYEKINASNVSHELATSEDMGNLHQALHDYSPSNFHPHIRDLEFAAGCFEQFYNEAAEKTTKEEVDELLFEWTKKIQSELEAKRAEYTPPTAQEVVKATRRTPVTSG